MEQHTLHYEVLNVFEPGETGQHWDVEVHATPEELQAFAETGYLIRENLFQGAALHKLRDALDQLEEREWEGRDSAIASKHGWGFIPRHLMDKDEAFLELLKFQPILSIVRAMMGPLVCLRGLSARITYPGGITDSIKRLGINTCVLSLTRYHLGFHDHTVLIALSISMI